MNHRWRSPDRPEVRPPRGNKSLAWIALGKNVCRFQDRNAPLVGSHDVAQSIEQFRVIVPPSLWPFQIANMASIPIVDFVWKEPPCHAKPIPW